MLRLNKVDAINQYVTGWMIPVMKRTDPSTGEVLNGLGLADFGRVKAGHGCPKCLAKFNTYMPVCPACDYARDVLSDVAETPQYWVDHLEDRANGSQGGRPLTADEFIAEVMADPDIEQHHI